jgi:predicted nucleic acid-binding protein
MARRTYVLDSSAIIAALDNEPGAERVIAVLKQERVIVPFIVLLEVYYSSWRAENQAVAEERLSYLQNCGAEIAWTFSVDLARIAADYKIAGKISLADAIIAAFTDLYDAVLVHKDPEYDTLAGKISLESLPYKQRLS